MICHGSVGLAACAPIANTMVARIPSSFEQALKIDLAPELARTKATKDTTQNIALSKFK
jgi:hypothetical protein